VGRVNLLFQFGVGWPGKGFPDQELRRPSICLHRSEKPFSGVPIMPSWQSPIDSRLSGSKKQRYAQIPMVQNQSSQPKPWAEKRRSQRVALSVPVLAYRRPKDGPRFFEGTHTLVVSAHGALIGLAAKVAPDERLVLQHSLSGEEQECRVVFTDKKLTGPTEVGVEFQRSAPDFWHIAFPPTDWAFTR
jgi:hypothetical protein